MENKLTTMLNVTFELPETNLVRSESSSSGISSIAESCDSNISSNTESSHKLYVFGDPDIIEPEYKIVPGFRRTSELIWIEDEQIYYKKNCAIKNGISYKCNTEDCSARVVRKTNGTVMKTQGYRSHNHKTNHRNAYEQNKILNEIKTRCLEDTSSKSA